MSWTQTQRMHSMATRIRQGKSTGLRNLKKIRTSRGLTRQAMADAIGAEISTYRQWEQERFFPNARWLPAMAEILECSIADLF